MDEVDNFFQDIKGNGFFIDDLPKSSFKNKKVAFVFESPHNDEIRCGYPIAGETGLRVSQFMSELFVNNGRGRELGIPFGKIIYDVVEPKNDNIVSCKVNKYQDILKKIAILNISNFPMQMDAYDSDFQRKYYPLLSNLETIKNGPEVDAEKRRGLYTKKLQNEITDQFEKKLNSLLACEVQIIVPFGRCAESFCRKYFSNLSSSFPGKVYENVPHPSTKNDNWTNFIGSELYNELLSDLKIHLF